MQIQAASRKRAKIKMGLQGPSGSGKTMGALLLAFGICGNWSKIAVIDTENHSANLYSHLGPYNVVNIGAPFSPEKYMEAIALCERSEMQVIIIDSVSHEWEGSGGILDVHSSMAGNSFTNWGKLTPRHNAFIQSILQSPCHVIATVRSKQDYVLQQKDGKIAPEKVGLKAVTRDGLDFELTLVFDLDIKHMVTVSKDRTGLFADKPEFKITSETGKQIAQWCDEGVDQDASSGTGDGELIPRIQSCVSVQELIELFKKQSAQAQKEYALAFTNRKQELQTIISSLPKPSTNGSTGNHSGK